MDILVTLNQNYLPQLKVMLTSLYVNQPEVRCNIYLLHRNIPDKALADLQAGLDRLGYQLIPTLVNEKLFEGAPITRQYPQEMYYRLLAAQLLPQNLKRILYLDPDILVINPLEKLWNLELGSYLFAAAAHTGKTELANNVNKLRLGTESDYFNSGVLLINLERCRREIRPMEIFAYVKENPAKLLLPDQDILNALYSQRILEIADSRWNYDARNFGNYLVRSHGEMDMAWVMRNTSILHFCGKAKPWKKHYTYRFGLLYRHYMRLTEQYQKRS